MQQHLPTRRRPAGFVLALGILLIGFAEPLFRLARFAAGSDLFSYIPLIPLISLWLLWRQRGRKLGTSPPSRRPAVVFLLSGAAVVLIACARPRLGAGDWRPQDFLSLTSAAFVLLLAGVCCWFLGRRTMRAGAFPLAFLALIVPLPVFLCDSIETALQHASAAAAYGLFAVSGMPVFQGNDLDFHLPGMHLQVAPQCSGFHSTLALAITSLPAGYLFLRSPWKRVALTVAAVPLGIVRNGFRIFVIGQLCVRIGPEMIDSYIHRTGGWIFFILFLAPFLVLLLLLARSERPAGRTVPAYPKA